jgi:hypothetical protein
MNFNTWLEQLKTEMTEIEPFISKLENFFNDRGFDSIGFENRVKTGLELKIKEVDDYLKEKENAEVK